MAWARREFEHVMAEGEPDQNHIVAAAGARLAELLHDQGEDLSAAGAMEKALGALDRVKDADGKPQEVDLKELRSRMHYYFACHWESKNERAKQREALDKAIDINPSDIDVLIACYRLPDQPAEYRAKVTALIQRTAAALHDEIVKNAADPSPCNNLAWLIANTEGDLDQAMKLAHKAVELSPKEGGFVDTLARVNYAKGDLENAVKLQTKAVEMEPHSGLIQRQLDVFRRKLEEKKKP
jgi:tetratricopeptide (TPR) repeat protein